MEIWQVIDRPLITEKNTFLVGEGKYTFKVATKANKAQISDAVEKIFKVLVADVNVMNVRGKERGVGRRKGVCPELEEGHRHPQARPADRGYLRGSLDKVAAGGLG